MRKRFVWGTTKAGIDYVFPGYSRSEIVDCLSRNGHSVSALRRIAVYR